MNHLNHLRQAQRRGAWLSGTLALGGICVLGGLAIWQSLPRPWWLWLLMAGAYLVLDLTAVEVSDRLMVSSSVMVAFAAAVMFGPDSGVLAVVAMSVAAAVHPNDVVQRRWRVPAANLGVLVLSTGSAMLVLYPFLPAGSPETGDLAGIAVGAALGAIAFDWVGFRMVRFMTRVLYPGRQMRPWSSLMPNHAAVMALAAFGALLGAAYHLVGTVVLGLMAITFSVGQFAFSSFSRMREAQLATIRGFVKAIEALDRHTKGHTDRVARFCEMAGERLGLEPEDLERLSWAALVHDVGKVAVPGELLRNPEPLSGPERDRVERRIRVVDDMLSSVDFLAPLVRISSDVRRSGPHPPDRIEARILAVADAFDSMTATRSYRSAITQAAAFAELRRSAGRFGSDAVEALIGAIEASGEVHGLPEAGNSAELDRLVRERAIRA